MVKKQKIDYLRLPGRSAHKMADRSFFPCHAVAVVMPAAIIFGTPISTLFTIHKKKPLVLADVNNAISQLEYMDSSQIYNLALSLVKSDNNFEGMYDVKPKERRLKDPQLIFKYYMKHVGFYALQVKLNLVFESMEKTIMEIAGSMKEDMINGKTNSNVANRTNNLFSSSSSSSSSSSTEKHILTIVGGKEYHLPLNFYNHMEDTIKSRIKKQVKPELQEIVKPEIIGHIKKFLLDRRDAGCKKQHFIVNAISQSQNDREALSSEHASTSDDSDFKRRKF